MIAYSKTKKSKKYHNQPKKTTLKYQMAASLQLRKKKRMLLSDFREFS